MDEATSIKSGGTTASNGTKRKRQSEAKFYAVRVGHKPGVYYTWADCLEQVKGFKKAMCKPNKVFSVHLRDQLNNPFLVKSFPSLIDAERFVAGEDPNGASSPAPKYYAVKSGRIPGIYTDWPAAQEQITGCQKPKHRCFSTRAEAQRFLDGNEANGAEASDLLPTTGGSFFTSHAPEIAREPSAESHVQKKAKKAANGSKRAKSDELDYNEADYEPGTGPLPPGAEDGFDPNVILDPILGNVVYKTQEQRQATKAAPGVCAQTGPIRIHTDGSSLGNGKAGAFAGVGVYFGPSDKRQSFIVLCIDREITDFSRNVSEALAGPRQTNQRAELSAVLRALEIVPRNRDIIIISDSKYAIDCVTTWFINWRRNGWKNTAGKAVENKDIIENILTKIEERNRLKVRTDFEWVKGHAGASGNEEADKLAVSGARKGLGLQEML